jgi:hypothetical protein
MSVGATSDAAPMADAVGEYIKKFPDRFVPAVDLKAWKAEAMRLADEYAKEVADTPNMPTPVERKLATTKIERARAALAAYLKGQR